MQHPDRDAQFRLINQRVGAAIAAGEPAISIDTKRKELVGEFKSTGREWRASGDPITVSTHVFPSQAIGKAIPYGVYDIASDEGFVNVGRIRLWKTELQRLADQTGLQIRVCHFPPGTSKWNKIEHRLACHISHNWRGRPLISYQVIINSIAATTTSSGLRVYARLDERDYPQRVQVSDDELAAVNRTTDSLHPEWNYTISLTHDSAA